MGKTVLFSAAAGLLCICSLAGSAQDAGYWRPDNSAAHTITGDISISDFRLSINFIPFTIAQIRLLKPAETAAAFDTYSHPGGGGYLYRLNVPATKQFLHKNTLCGSDEAQWMATYAAGNDLQVAFFSGSTMPVLTSEALANSTNLCGMFTYIR